MKPIRLTHHAAIRQRERTYPIPWIERTVRTPLWTEPDPDDPEVERRFALVPEYGNRMLRVACVETETDIRVISVTLDRNAKRRHERGDIRP